ncbi:MAG: F0F1 ATP synthase subunit epsilon [Pseudomonadales bacterium]|nr:F0F1 ATP synthase subunit epsilon [Pseudomonadales bacterium]
MNKTLTLRCLDDRSVLEIPSVLSITATDASGQFGVLPDHAAFLTLLMPGLLVYRVDNNDSYIATDGGMFSLKNNIVNIVSTRFLQSGNIHSLLPELQENREKERESRHSSQRNSADLMHTLVKRLQEWQELK